MGRPLGAPNKRPAAMRFDLIQTLRDKGYDPAASLMETRFEAMKQYKKRTAPGKSGFGGVGFLEIVRGCDAEIMQYVYPKLKSTELTGANGADLFESFTAMIKRIADSKE